MARVAVISEADSVWGLSAWEQALPLLARDGHEVVGLWQVPPRMAQHTGFGITRWYMQRFGVCAFLVLALFAVVHGGMRFFLGRPRSLRQMCERYGVSFFTTRSPNDASFVQWLAQEQVDVLLISVGHILKPEVLGAVRVGVINKHAGVLPANKGLLPYIWAVAHGMAQGVSYHKVTEHIDAGPLLVQHNDVPPDMLRSMIAFYAHVYRLFPVHMREAVRALLAQHFLPQADGGVARLHHLPDGAAMQQFRDKGGVIVRLCDVRYALQLLEEPA